MLSHKWRFFRFPSLYDSDARIALLKRRAAAGGRIRRILFIGDYKMFFGQLSAASRDPGRSRLRARLLGNSLLLAISAANCAYADSNILPNGDFGNEQQISGWAGDPAGSISFNTSDFDGSIESGSMVVQGGSFRVGTATSSCFSVESRTGYTFGGDFKASVDIGLGNDGQFTYSCKQFSTADCSGSASDLGTHSVDFEMSTTGPFSLPFSPTANTARAARCSVSIEATTEGSDPALLSVDNLHFANTNPNPVSLGGYLSGSWYDPTQSGQGFQLEFTGQANTVVAAWFTFAPDGSGKPIWIYAQGEYDPLQSVVTIPAAISSGTNFPPAFHGSDITKTPWGTLTFTFTDCDHASVAWKSTLPGFGSGTQQLRRLTSIDGLSCPATGVFF